jgi:hypothetical protein
MVSKARNLPPYTHSRAVFPSLAHSSLVVLSHVPDVNIGVPRFFGWLAINPPIQLISSFFHPQSWTHIGSSVAGCGLSSLFPAPLPLPVPLPMCCYNALLSATVSVNTAKKERKKTHDT